MVLAILGGKTVTRRPFGGPQYQTGDVLYVREAWSMVKNKMVFRAGYSRDEDVSWHPSIHMRREDARLFLDVTGSRLERLNTMTEQDARREGSGSLGEFKTRWDAVYASKGYAWASNPLVDVTDFKVNKNLSEQVKDMMTEYGPIDESETTTEPGSKQALKSLMKELDKELAPSKSDKAKRERELKRYAEIIRLMGAVKTGQEINTRGAQSKLKPSKTLTYVMKLLKHGVTPAAIPHEVTTRFPWDRNLGHIKAVAKHSSVEPKLVLKSLGFDGRGKRVPRDTTSDLNSCVTQPDRWEDALSTPLVKKALRVAA